jgi:hypothetical protein
MNYSFYCKALSVQGELIKGYPNFIDFETGKVLSLSTSDSIKMNVQPHSVCRLVCIISSNDKAIELFENDKIEFEINKITNKGTIYYDELAYAWKIALEKGNNYTLNYVITNSSNLKIVE